MGKLKRQNMKISSVLLTTAAFLVVSYASPSCSSFDDCTSCTSHSTWMPGSHCRWCPKENGRNCHAEGSMYDTCSSSEIITSPSKCASPPAPSPPAPSPPAPVPRSSLPEKVLA